MATTVTSYDVISIGLVLALWSGSRALNVFVDTVTIMYGLGGHRGIVKTRVLSFVLYVLGLVTGVVTIPLVVAGPSADAQPSKLEAAYVVLGPQGPVARAVLAQASSCPDITIDGAQQPMSVRALPDATFPVLVCERAIPAGATSASLENSPLPLPSAFGDTGCRLKSAKTAAKEGDSDDADARGKFQDCNNPTLWPFAQVAQSVAG